MPIQIPTYFSRTAPGVVDRGRTSPEATGLPVAEGLHSVASALAAADIEAERQVGAVARMSDYVARKNRMSDRLGELSLSLEKDPDPNTYFDRAKKGIQEISTEALSGVNDPALKTELLSHVSGTRDKFMNDAKHKAWSLTVDRSKAVLEDDIDRSVKDATTATDASVLQQAEGRIDASLKGAVAGGIWSAEIAGKLKKHAQEKIYTTLAEQMADREPSRFLSNDKEGLYKDTVDPLRLEGIRRYAQHRSLAIDGAVAATAVWEELGPKKDEDPINEDLMVRKLEAQFAGEPDKARVAIASVKEKAYAHDKGVKERKDANLSEIWKASMPKDQGGGGLSTAAIVAMPQYSALDGNSRRQVMEHLEDRAWTRRQRVEEDPARKAAQHELYWRYSQPGVLVGMSENAITALYPNLGVPLTDKLMDDKRKLERPEKLLEAKIDQDDFNHYARQAGIDPESKGKKAVLGEIKFGVENAIDAEQRAKGRPLTREEKAKIMKRGLVEVDTRVSIGFLGMDLGTGTRKKRVFDVQYPGNIVIPPAERDRITADLLARAIPVTEDNIRNLYIRQQVK